MEFIMNFKKLTFTLALTLCAVQTTFGMRRTINPVKQTFRSMSQRTFKGNKLNATISKKFPKTPTALGIGLGLYGTHYAFADSEQETEVGEEQITYSIEKLDVTEIDKVIEAFKYAEKRDKRTIAEQVAKRITQYSVADIVKMLQHTEHRPHRTLVNALAKNITNFKMTQITEVLQADQHDETHQLLAQAFNKNFLYFIEGSNWKILHTLNRLTSEDVGVHIFTMWELGAILNTLNKKHVNKLLETLIDYEETIAVKQNIAILSANIFSRSRQDIQEKIVALMVEKNPKQLILLLKYLWNDDEKQNKKIVIAAITTQFATLIQSHTEWVQYLTATLARCNNKKQKETLIQGFIDNLATNNQQIARVFTSNSIDSIIKLLELSTDIQKALVPYIEGTITKYSYSEVLHFIDSCTEEHQRKIQLAYATQVGSWPPLNTCKNSELGTLYKLSDKSTKKEIVDIMVQRIITKETSINMYYFHAIIMSMFGFYEPIPNDKNLRAEINKLLFERLNDLLNLGKEDSQTINHLKENMTDAWKYLSTVARDPNHKALCEKAIAHEQTLSNEAAVFYHAQKSDRYWLELFYTKLWERKYQQKNKNYIFTHFPDDHNNFANAVLQHIGHQKRKKWIAKEFIQTDAYYEGLSYPLLFCNYALFANSSYPGALGSSSIDYFLNNYNAHATQLTTQIVFNKFGTDKLYANYKAKIGKLESEFKKIVPKSVLVQLILSQETVQNYVVCITPSANFFSEVEINGKKTGNINTILHTLKTAPDTIDNSDFVEFGVVMTPDTVHILREQGAEIRVYGTHDQEKLDALIAELEALIDKIAIENPEYFSPQLTPTQSYEAYKDIIKALTK